MSKSLLKLLKALTKQDDDLLETMPNRFDERINKMFAPQDRGTAPSQFNIDESIAPQRSMADQQRERLILNRTPEQEMQMQSNNLGPMSDIQREMQQMPQGPAFQNQVPTNELPVDGLTLEEILKLMENQ